MLIVHFRFNEVLYQNTLFDVEIIDNAKGNDSPLMLVCDLMMLKNRNVQIWDPIRRINTLHTLFENQFHNNLILQPTAIQIKAMYCTNNFEEMKTFVKTLPYTIRGLNFIPLNSKYPVRTWIDNHGELIGHVVSDLNMETDALVKNNTVVNDGI